MIWALRTVCMYMVWGRAREVIVDAWAEASISVPVASIVHGEKEKKIVRNVREGLYGTLLYTHSTAM